MAASRAIPVSIGALIAALAMVLLLVMPASANSVLTATLTGASEVPPNTSTATGDATITALDNGTICWDITFTGLNGDDAPSGGHIHEAPAGTNGDVVLNFGLTAGTTSPIQGCAEPASADANDPVRLLAQDLQDAPADYYVNLHNTEFSDGVIRGQLAGDDVLEPVEAVAYVNPDVGLATANGDVNADSSCETPDRTDTQTVSSTGGTENNVHIDACLFDANGDYIDASVSFESTGVGTISACPDPDAEGPKTSTSDGTTCTQSGFQLMGAPGPFEYHARVNSEVAGTQTVVFCYDPGANGCGAEDTVLDTITITWVAAAEPETGELMIMKHYCNADDSNPETTVDVRSEEEFKEVEAKGGGDPVIAVALTILACPVERLPGDEKVADTIAHFEEEFDFLITDSAGETFTLAKHGVFTPAHVCEQREDTDRGAIVIGEVDGDEDTNVCVDFSFYTIDGVAEGPVTVVETFHEGEHEFGTVRLTPAELGSDDRPTLLGFNRQTSTVNIDTSLDGDAMAMLHIYNFDTAGAGPTPAPIASELPDAAVNPTGTFGSSSVSILFGILALASIGFIGFRTVAVRRNR